MRLTFDEMRRKMSNGRKVSVRDAHRHRAMRVEVADDQWVITVFGSARLPGASMDERPRFTQYKVRRDSALRFACSTAQKNRIPMENIEMVLKMKTTTKKAEDAESVRTTGRGVEEDQRGEEVLDGSTE
jgi:hypothetical protein